jgi:hypothetical protein
MIIIPANTLSAGGYDVANSCRFNSGSSDSLTRSTTAGNRTTWTFSTWFKRSKLGVLQSILQHDDANYFRIRITSGDVFEVFDSNGNNTWNWYGVLRDTSAWYHIVLRGDSTDGTNGNRLRLYVNGSLASANTVASIAEDYTFSFNQGGTLQIGKRGSTDYLDGYLAETILIDGSALAPDQFGEFDSDSPTIWKPIDVSGLTFGTQGFYLDFENSGSLGADVSGNSNNFTVNNLTAIDQTTDTCTNNFATMNPLDNFYQNQTFSEGNLKVLSDNPSPVFSTIGMTTGKWYMEAKAISGVNDYQIGICSTQVTSTSDEIGLRANDWGYKASDGKYKNNGTDNTYGSTYDEPDIIGVYLDLDNNKLYFAKNGTIQNSGTGISITDPASTPLGAYFFTIGANANATKYTWEVNFGNPTYTGTDQTDANGYGSFEYDPSSGTFDSASKDFLAICTKNLAEYG